MLKKTTIKIAVAFIILIAIYFSIIKICTALPMGHDTMFCMNVLFTLGILYAYLGNRYISNVLHKKYRKNEICGISVLLFVLGATCTYFSGISITAGFSSLFTKILKIDSISYLVNEDLYFVMGIVSAFWAVAVYSIMKKRYELKSKK